MNQNLIWYIEKYGDKKFSEKKINEIDYLIFSQIVYNDYSSVLKNFFSRKSLKEVTEKVLKDNPTVKCEAKMNAFEIFAALKGKRRYQNVKLMFHKTIVKEGCQFMALTIKAGRDYIVSFEGTDSTVNGWKEDFYLTYDYPTFSQKHAGNYLNKVLFFLRKKVTVVGHSKGGNTAIASCLRLNRIYDKYINKIYSFDGPGFRDNEYKSERYNEIDDKIINVMPQESMIGILFNHKNERVILSNAKGIMQHSALSWQVGEDSFIKAKQTKASMMLEKTMNEWLLNLSYEQRYLLTYSFFNLLKQNNINDFYQIKADKKKIIAIIKSTKTIPISTKKKIIECFTLLGKEITKDIYDSYKKSLKTTVSKGKKYISSKIGKSSKNEK